MTPAQLSDAIVAALTAQVEAGTLRLPDGVPSRGGRGASAEQGARRLRDQRRAPAGQEGGAWPPRELAQSLADALGATDGIAKVDIAGPGFLNITVSAGAQGKVAADVVAAGASYGASRRFAGEKINVEFISANPTGPLHLGHIRWAAVGDALAPGPRRCRRRGRPRVLHQRPRRPDGPVRRLAGGASARVSRCPEDGYDGQYIDDIAEGGRRAAGPIPRPARGRAR